jgi:peptidoglycan LD-endopeptidase CwlK
MELLSEQRLADGIPALAIKVRAAHDKMLAAVGKGFRVAQCVRSYQDSDADYAKGRTAPGAKVTNAPGGYSWHNFGMAVDCYPFTVGDSGALDWNPSDQEFQQMVQFMKAEGLVWGGDWHSLKDYPHFQLGNIPVSPGPTDRAAFTAGGMNRVWSLYTVRV